jgi:hypothetical protein
VENGPQTCGSSCKKQDGECQQFTQWLCDQLHITAATVQYAKELHLIYHSQGSKSRVIAKSAKSVEPVLKLMDVLLYSLRQPIFKSKKVHYQ